MLHVWKALKQDIQNEVRIWFPEPQVLLSFLSAMNKHYQNFESLSKRKAESDLTSEHYMNDRKKLKASTANEDVDILVVGVGSFPELNSSGDCEGVVDSNDEHQSSNGTDFAKTIRDIWGLHQCSLIDIALEEGETYLYSKLLDVLQIYLRTMAAAFEGSFDFFKLLPTNPSSLPPVVLQSLLPLLIQHVGWFSNYETPVRTQTQMYRHLHPFLSLLIYSPNREIKEQAYVLAQAAMLSTGAFDNNTREIFAWFFFIPGYNSNSIYKEEPVVEIFQKLSSVIVSFLCDAVSTIGNNLFKYMDLLRRYTHDKEGGKDLIPEFSPFIICTVEKCLRLLSSGSIAFTLPQKTLISLYVCCTVKYIMDTQVDAGPLSFLIDKLLSEKSECSSSKVDVSDLWACPCEWRPLKTLLLFSQNIMQQLTYKISSIPGEVMHSDSSFVSTLMDVKRAVNSECSIGLVGSTLGFSFSMTCTSPADILWNFPSVISIANDLFGAAFPVLASIFFLQSSFLTDVSKLWPEMFTAGLESVRMHGEERKDEMIHKIDLYSIEAASAAFCLYLEKAPFHVLFSAIAHSSDSHLYKHPKLRKLLLAKLSEMPRDHLITSFCSLLSWINQAQSSYRARPLDELETLSEVCSTLAGHSLKQIFVENTNNFSCAYAQAPLQLKYAAEVAEITFNHPAVTASLKCRSSGDEDLTDSVFGETSEILLQVAKQGVHRMNLYVLNLLGTTCELLFSSCNRQRSQSEDRHSNTRIAKAFKSLVHKLFLTFKNKFDGCIKTKDLKPLLPTFYALHTLIRFISPFELLELVKWLFSKIDFHDVAFCLSLKISALSVGLHIACWAFDFLLGDMWQPFSGSIEFNFLGGVQKSVDVALFEGIFFQVYEIANRFELDVADTCLLKAVKVVRKMHKVVQNPCLHSIMVLTRIIASTPLNTVSHCLHNISKTKAELLFLISEISPLHLSISGHMTSEMPNKPFLPQAKSMPQTCLDLFSDEEVVMHLPAVLLYLNSILLKFGRQFYQHLEHMISCYGRRLLDGFSNWNSFVSKEIFEIGIDESFPLSREEFLNLFSNSLLLKSIFLVRYNLLLSGHSLKLERRSTLFDSVCPYVSEYDNLLDCDHDQMEFDSLKKSLNFVNRAVAKIKFCSMLLFPDYNQHESWVDNGETKMKPLEVTSHVLDKSRIRFVSVLIHSWMLLVKKFPGNIDHCKQFDGKNISLFRFLEVFIMGTVSDLTALMHDSLIRLDSLAVIELFAKSFLLYRFDDPATLKTLRTVLMSLSLGNFSCITLLQLLLAHSQFTKTIHLSCKSVDCTQFGLVFTPMQSMLRSLVISHTDVLNRRDNMTSSQLNLKQLELVKLVRVLFCIKAVQSKVNGEGDTGINSKELLYLLLSSYGATLSEVDLEIYNLMIEIESGDKSSTGTIAEMDYLWGITALKVRKEREQDMGISSLNNIDVEAFEDRRRIQFREHVPIDPKLCAQTVLYFPYDRTVKEGNISKLKKDNFEDVHEDYSVTFDQMQTYDPVFILRFSVHCLSMGFIEPIEFASLGLLAVTFVSISSPDIDMRKLAYEALAKFKTALEKCQKRKDVTRLRLLLSYLQNGIEEPWQRIPSIIAVFVAEASFVLLDPSHDNYSAISKNIMHCSSVDMKTIPLFPNFFWSSSVSFKTDRLWILRLLYAGLNTEGDAQIYIRNSSFEMLMSFYESPLSDNTSKELIIQIVRKAVKLHKMTWFLVEHCGLILWLSSIVSSLCWKQYEDRKNCIFTQLPIILEVINDVTSARNIVEWLQKYALEQLSELSCHLYKLLVGDSELMKEQRTVNSILQILRLVLKISQKRKVYQPHFTLSDDGIFQLCEAIDLCSKNKYSPCAVLGLKAVLMSTPPITIMGMDQENLSKFLSWAVRTAIQSESKNAHKPEESDYRMTALSEKEEPEDSLVSKLLRWLTASVILGKVSCKLHKSNTDNLLEQSNINNLQSLLECHEKGFGEHEVGYGFGEILAASIFYLQQLLGLDHRLLPSVVSALSLLLFSAPSSTDLEITLGLGISLPSPLSKIRCPAEANPAWRWSYSQPWRDLSSEHDGVKKMDEIHACELLLVVISNILGRKSLCTHFISLEDEKISNVFEWERSILDAE